MSFTVTQQTAIENAIINLLRANGPQRLGELITLLTTYPRLTEGPDHDFLDVNETNIMPILTDIQGQLFRFRMRHDHIQGAPYYYGLRAPGDPENSFDTVYRR